MKLSEAIATLNENGYQVLNEGLFSSPFDKLLKHAEKNYEKDLKNRSMIVINDIYWKLIHFATQEKERYKKATTFKLVSYIPYSKQEIEEINNTEHGFHGNEFDEYYELNKQTLERSVKIAKDTLKSLGYEMQVKYGANDEYANTDALAAHITIIAK